MKRFNGFRPHGYLVVIIPRVRPDVTRSDYKPTAFPALPMCIFLAYCRLRFNNNYLNLPYPPSVETHSNVLGNKRERYLAGFLCIILPFVVDTTAIREHTQMTSAHREGGG